MPPIGPALFSRFKHRRMMKPSKLKPIPIPGKPKSIPFLHEPDMDYMRVALFQETGSGWYVIMDASHGPFESIEVALTCWAANRGKVDKGKSRP